MPEERGELVNLERANNAGHCMSDGYLPDDCAECPYCENPHMGMGLCRSCLQRLIALVDKGNGSKGV
jgi:hypothetical protein